ncbi:hypothetical protein [Clostridium folliculivorans]|uniref:Uncharacterized protein n=1 Tax=Clostridium folliculivorans TaxID=2886038 RepID=A0A9W6DBV9_9CLOT|nr:hypothetical protein [Clostridium folliculivorans]GKU26118.1 hypothetical protein CFOLD11_29450 [Clostridium folliculivorans]GKU28204.1 hypothetical protein CFB3_03100 [Clostridium folliculivorans]
MKLFSLSEGLKSEILKAVKNVEREVYQVRFKGYVVLMDFAQRVVLIFDLINRDINFRTDLAIIEDRIRKITGSTFWVRMTDEVYESSGLITGTFSQNVVKINNYIDDRILNSKVNSYSKYIMSDLMMIRKYLNLKDTQSVWEIAPSKREDITAIISIVEHKNEKKFRTVREEIVKLEGNRYIVLHFDDETRFKSMNKLYILAEENKSSVVYEAIKYTT